MPATKALRIPILCICAAVTAISVLALAGWVLDIQILKAVRADWIAMRIPTAAGLICCAAALFAARDNGSRANRAWCRGFGGAVGFIGVTSLLSYFRPLLPAGDAWMPAPLTSAIFIGFGIVFLFLASPGKRGSDLAHVAAVPLALASFLILIGYLFDVNVVHTWKQVPVALNTGIAFCALSTGLFLVRPATWFMRVLLDAGPGAALARVLLPAAVAVPVLIGRLRFAGEQAGLMPPAILGAVAVIGDAFVMVWILWLTARSANREDERYRNLVEMSPDALFVYREGRIVQVNRAALVLLGADEPDQLIGKTAFDLFAPEYHPIIRERHKLLLSGRPVPLIEEKIVRLDGTVRDVEVAASPLAERRGLSAQVILRDITGRKLAEEALARSREWLRVTLSSIGDAVLATDTAARITFLNPVAAALTGWSEAEALGRPARDVLRTVNESTGEAAEDIIGRVLTEGCILTMANHTALVARDGREIPIEDSAAPIRDAGGNVAGAVLVFHDVTAKRRERDRLVQLNRTLRAHSRSDQALLHASDEKSYLDEVCRIIVEDCGHAMVWIGFREDDENCSIRPAAYSGFEEGYLETLHLTWADRERGRGPTGMAIRTGQVCTCRNMLTDPAFEPWREHALRRGYASSIVLPLMEDGIAFGALSIYSREPDPFSDDEVKLLSEIAADLAYGLTVLRLRAAHAEAEVTLRENESRLRTLSNNLPEAVLFRYRHDAQGKPSFEFVSAGIERLTGIPAAEFMADAGTIRESILPEEHDRLAAAIVESRERLTQFEVEVRRRHRVTGETRWSLLRSTPTRNSDGSTTWDGIELDVTGRKRAEEEIRVREEQLRQAQKMESIGVLAGGIAHDFNNLLVGVIGNASLAEDMLPPGSPVIELLRHIVASGETAAHLTRQMLAYAGKGQFVVEPVNFSGLVRETVRLIQSSISKKIRLDLRLASVLPPVESDASQMQQVLMNLVLNAAEAAGSGSGEVLVRTGETSLNGERGVFLEVSDNGCGMDAATRARIFEPFFTTKFQGRGLGLAAVDGIVRAQKGIIEVTTAPGAGSTFRVVFPAMSTTALPAPAELQQPIMPGQGTVLVVDDEEIVRATAKNCLERRGYEVLLAGNGPDAIEVVRREGHRIGVVVLDLSMPGMSGEEALPHLRKLRPDLEVIVSSGYSEAEALRLFRGVRVTGFLQKPYTVQELARKVQSTPE